MKASNKFVFGILVSMLSLQAYAENYVGVSLGYSFSQRLNNLTGNENTNYPDPADTNDQFTYFPGAHISDVNLDNSLSAGIRFGHWFESQPNWGVEIEGNFSRPDFKRQDVTISHPALGQLLSYATAGEITQSYITEDQDSAKIKLFQVSADVMYRFSSEDKLKPYIGAGPTLNVMKISGTGSSGRFVSPDANTMLEYCNLFYGPGPNISETMVRVGANVKAGLTYSIDEDLDLGVEYKFNWTPVHISNFRSQSDLEGDYFSHALSAVLIKKF